MLRIRDSWYTIYLVVCASLICRSVNFEAYIEAHTVIRSRYFNILTDSILISLKKAHIA